MKKNKKGIIVLCVILAVIIAGGATAYGFLPHPLNYPIKTVQSIGSSVEIVSSCEDKVVIKNTEDRDFRIMTFTDMHLDGKNKTSYITVSWLIDNIEKEKPDLVVLGGDTVTSAFNRSRAKQLGKIFEQLGVYWAPVLGNHEGDNAFSIKRPEMVGIFSSFEHCLMLEGKQDIWGDGNYCVEILNKDNTLCRSLVLMDTGDEADAETMSYYNLPVGDTYNDGVKDSQIDWYKSIIADGKKTYGNYPSTLFVHIPLPQYKTEAEKGRFEYGEKLENVCATEFESGLFDVMKDLGSTDSVFCGHDHLNTFGVKKDGILLAYMQPSGYGSYTAASRLGYEEKEWLQGYMLMTIEKNGVFTTEYHRNSEG